MMTGRLNLNVGRTCYIIFHPWSLQTKEESGLSFRPLSISRSQPTLDKCRRERLARIPVTLRQDNIQVSAPLVSRAVERKQLDDGDKIIKEAHKYFDQVNITVRGGDGGDGAVLKLQPPKNDGQRSKRGRRQKGFKRSPDGSLLLPMGGTGGDVYIVADESLDTLLELHTKKRHNARRGGAVDSMAGMGRALVDGLSAPTLKVLVPVGTVVKRKRGAKVLADLARHGEQVLVARGGRGGTSILELSKAMLRKQSLPNAPVLTDPEDKELTKGLVGEEVALELTLRVVADVGLVGLPNAGKSSTLAAVTEAKPAIADYPFTTLMPNLGRIGGDPLSVDGGFAAGPTLADMPGLIEGAHLGKGLGRMFLRHLRRTRLLVHVVDAAAPDPVGDYLILREELRMYNPEYVQRPHIVVLNKMDVEQARSRLEELTAGIRKASTSSYGSLGLYVDGQGGDQDGLDEREEREKKVEVEQFGEEAGTAEPEMSEQRQDLEAEGSVRGKSKSGVERRGSCAEVGSRGRGRSYQGVEGGGSREDGLKENIVLCAPIAVVGISARQKEGIQSLMEVIRTALQSNAKASQIKVEGTVEQRQMYKDPTWQV